MNRLFLAATAIVPLLAGVPAKAADMPPRASYKAPPPAPVYNWTGFYVGAGFGYGMFNADSVLIHGATGQPDTPNVTAGGRGLFGTVLVGGDYQFSERIVAGVFADFDFSRIKGDLGIVEFSGEMKQTSA